MQVLMNGFKYNESVSKLDLADNELFDEQGIYLLQMVKFLAEKRDRGQWLVGLRQP